MNRLLLILILLIIPNKILCQEYIDTSQVYLTVDTMPRMANGQDLRSEFLNIFFNEIKVPDSTNCLITKIKFEFVVSYDGRLENKNVSFPNIIDDECSGDYLKWRKAALDFLDKFPICIPGKLKGERVKVKLIVPIIIDFNR